MAKTINYLVLILLLSSVVSAIGFPEFPEEDFCDEASCVCGDGLCVLDESFPDSPFYCLEDCGTTCEEAGYFAECDSCCEESLPSRAEVDDYCRGYGFIRLEDCPDCPECVCGGGGGYSSCSSCCPVTDSGFATAANATGGTRECPIQWLLLIIGIVIGYLFSIIYDYSKKRR